MNETLRVLRERRSIRRYQSGQIKPEELDAILDAGTWAPSGMGLQTAVMVAVQDPETIAYMSRLNAQIQGKPGTDPFYGAPTVVTLFAPKNFLFAAEDCAAAAENMMLAADALGIGSCYIGQGWTAFADPFGQETLQSWGIPATHYAVMQLLLGYPRQGGAHPAPKPRKAGRVLRF